MFGVQNSSETIGHVFTNVNPGGSDRRDAKLEWQISTGECEIIDYWFTMQKAIIKPSDLNAIYQRLRTNDQRLRERRCRLPEGNGQKNRIRAF